MSLFGAIGAAGLAVAYVNARRAANERRRSEAFVAGAVAAALFAIGGIASLAFMLLAATD